MAEPQSSVPLGAAESYLLGYVTGHLGLAGIRRLRRSMEEGGSTTSIHLAALALVRDMEASEQRVVGRVEATHG